jgi:peroxiredoxin Q/BCP
MQPTLTALAALAFALALSTPASAALAVGAQAPDFTAGSVQGGIIMAVKLSDLLKKGPVVLYFFPSAFTGGSSAESREFADNIEKFRAAGATVLGMSRDTVETLARFSTEECASKFPVASADESIVNGFDVNDGAMFNTRTTYVIASSGKIVFVRDDEDYSGHVKKTLEFVQAMKK